MSRVGSGARALRDQVPEVVLDVGPFLGQDAEEERIPPSSVRAHVPAGDRSWEDRLVAALTAGGAVVERDERLAYPMSHPDAAACFDAHVHSGPMRPLAAARGDEFVCRLRGEFLGRSPAGDWHHRPQARHLVAARPGGPAPVTAASAGR